LDRVTKPVVTAHKHALPFQWLATPDPLEMARTPVLCGSPRATRRSQLEIAYLPRPREVARAHGFNPVICGRAAQVLAG
jgi:hypothetical protein